MMIYNTVDHPVILTIGDQTYRMERDSELELKIPSGEYPFRAYIAKKNGQPLIKYSVSRRTYTRSSNYITYIYMTSAALLTVRRDTKIYIREAYEQLSGNRAYLLATLDFEVVNGEIQYRKEGFVSEEVKRKIVRSYKARITAGIILAALLLAISIVFWCLLLSVSKEATLTFAEVEELWAILLAPLVLPIIIVWEIMDTRYIKFIQKLPVLPDEIDYEFI